MKLLIVVLLGLGLCTASMASATNGTGFIMTVWEVGSPHMEQVWFGLTPTDYYCGVPFDPYSQVHISLPTGLQLDFRPTTTTDRSFTSSIWWTNSLDNQFELSLSFLQGDTESFSWGFPTAGPSIAVTEGSHESRFTIPLSADPFVYHGSGNAQVAVDFGQGSTVPELSAFLLLGSGALGVVLRRKLT